MTLEQFIESESDYMLQDLTAKVEELKRWMRSDPKEFTEYGSDEPSIDIRLCIDPGSWIFRTGDSSFDPRHSIVCAGSCITLETDPAELLKKLCDEACDCVTEPDDNWGPQ